MRKDWLAGWARDLKFRSFYVLDDGEAYGASVAALFARRAAQLGLTNTGHQTIDKTAKDFEAVLAEVKQARPDVVYFGGTVATGAALIVKQIERAGHLVGLHGAGCHRRSVANRSGRLSGGRCATRRWSARRPID